MPKYEQQADFDAASGADEVERERRMEPAPFTEEWLDDGGPRWAAQQVLEHVANGPSADYFTRLARKALGRS